MTPTWKYKGQKGFGTREICIGEDIAIGGDTGSTLIMAGPCSAESWEQLDLTAQTLIENEVKIIRAGCFKPRTSPYKFQGLEQEGLRLLSEIRRKYGLKIITEVKDSTHVDQVIEYADIIQIGAKAMWDYGILDAVGHSRKPVLLKRNFGARLEEFVNSAEFILNAGNPNVILCERGIRSIETRTRFTLDLCGVAWLKKHTDLPVVLDPSHAMGERYGVPDLSRACVAMGVDGLLLEVHPNPDQAKSDAAQQLDLNSFSQLKKSLKPIAAAIGRQLI